MRFLAKAIIVFVLGLSWGCGSDLTDTPSPATITQTAPVAQQQVTVTLTGTSLARTANRFASDVTVFRVRLLNVQAVPVASVAVSREAAKDTQTVTLAVPALLNLTLTVEAQDHAGTTLLSLERQVDSSGLVRISDSDFSSGPLPAALRPTSEVSCGGLPLVYGLNPYRGLGGNLTIQGKNLYGIGYVSFGDQYVKVGAWSGQDCINPYTEWLQVVAPERPVGTRSFVSFIYPNGMPIESTDLMMYYYTDSPVPVVSSLVPDRGPIGGGTEVTLTGRGFTGVADVFFGGASAQVKSFISDTQITVTTPAGSTPGTYPVRVVYLNSAFQPGGIEPDPGKPPDPAGPDPGLVFTYQ